MRFTDDKAIELSSPINEEGFCGGYLKSNRQLFRPLRNEFNLAQTSQRQLVQNPDPNEIDALHESNVQNWSALSDSLYDVFKTSSRDIELASWMLTAQVISDPSLQSANNFSGWFASLVQEHWQSLHPILPEGKIRADDDFGKAKEIAEFKLKAFIQLTGESEDSSLLYSPLLMLPLIGDLTYSRYLSEERKGSLAELRQTYHSIAMTHRNDVTLLVNNLDAIRINLTEIESQVKQYSQEYLLAAPSFQFVLGLLTKLINVIDHIAGVKPESQIATSIIEESSSAEEPHTEVNATTEGEAMTTSNVDQVMVSAPAAIQTVTPVSFTSIADMQVKNRDQAFHQMRELAEFFKKTEPHSPVSYLLEKAIRWGYLSLPELMSEMLSHQQDTINSVFNLSGLDEDGQTQLPERNMAQPSVATASISVAEPSPAVVPEEPAKEKQEEQEDTSSSDSLW